MAVSPPPEGSPPEHEDVSTGPGRSSAPENIDTSPHAPQTPRPAGSECIDAAGSVDSPPSSAVPRHPWPPAPLAPGVDPKAPRTANRVYSSLVAGMLTEAQHKFECLVFIENAYPNIDMQIKWSIACWEQVCIDSKNYFNLGRDIMNLVRPLIIMNLSY